MSSVFDALQSAFSSSSSSSSSSSTPAPSSSSFLSSSPVTSKFLGGKPQPQPPLAPSSSSSDPSLPPPPPPSASSSTSSFHRESPATLERDLHLQTELLQAFVRSSLLRHARCAFRALVELASSPAALATWAALDENVPQVAHLLYTLEMLLCHGLTEKKLWFEDKKGLWGVLEGFTPLVHKSQTETARDFNLSISDFEKVSNSAHKARAWIRKALMEKVFCDYIKIIALNEQYLRDHYEGYAVIRSEEFTTFLGTLQGLNAVSFSFVFKDASFDLRLSDISKFISVLRESDPDESVSLVFGATHAHKPKAAESGDPQHAPRESVNKEELEGLKEALAKSAEQNSYLEEINRHLKATLDSEDKRKERDVASFAETQRGWEAERLQFQNIIIELQERLSNAEEEGNRLRTAKQTQSKKIDEMAGELVALEHLTLELQASNPQARPQATRTLTGSSSLMAELVAPSPSTQVAPETPEDADEPNQVEDVDNVESA